MTASINRAPSRMLLALAVFLCALPADAEEFEVTRDAIRDAILNPEAFTPEQLDAMDLNRDGKIDVADLVYRVSEGELALVAFQESMTVAYEGGGPVTIPVAYTEGFEGQVSYAVSGDAQPGEDYQSLPGALTLNGSGQAGIEVNLIDDLEITVDEDGVPITRTLTIDLVSGDGYDPNYITSHTVIIVDNDAYWAGSAYDGRAGWNFTLAVARDASGDVAATLSSDGVGTFQKGDWDAEVSSDGGEYVFEFTDIGVPASHNTAGVGFTRELKFRIANDIGSPDVDTVSGEVTDQLVSSEHTHLNRTTEAAVSLTRIRPVFVTPEPELRDLDELLSQ